MSMYKGQCFGYTLHTIYTQKLAVEKVLWIWTYFTLIKQDQKQLIFEPTATQWPLVSITVNIDMGCNAGLCVCQCIGKGQCFGYTLHTT